MTGILVHTAEYDEVDVSKLSTPELAARIKGFELWERRQNMMSGLLKSKELIRARCKICGDVCDVTSHQWNEKEPDDTLSLCAHCFRIMAPVLQKQQARIRQKERNT